MKKIKKGIIPALAVLINVAWIPTVAAQCSANSGNNGQDGNGQSSVQKKANMSEELIKEAFVKSAKEIPLPEYHFKKIKLNFGTVLTTDIVAELGFKKNILLDVLKRYNFRIYKKPNSTEVEIAYAKGSKLVTMKIKPTKFAKFLSSRAWKLDEICDALSSSTVYYGPEDDFKNLMFPKSVNTDKSDMSNFRDTFLIGVDTSVFDKYENLQLTFSKNKNEQTFTCDVNYYDLSRKLTLTINKYSSPPWVIADKYYEAVKKINYSFAKQQDFKNAEYDGDYANFAAVISSKGLNVKLPDPAKDKITFHAKKVKNSQDVTYTIEKEWIKRTFVVKFATFKEQMNNADLNLEDIKKTKLITYLTAHSFQNLWVNPTEDFASAMQKIRLDDVKKSVHPRPGVVLKAKKSSNSTEVTFQAWAGNYVKELKINYKLFKDNIDYVNRMYAFLTNDKQKHSYKYNSEYYFKKAEWKDTNKYFPKTVAAFDHLSMNKPNEKNSKFKIILTKNKGTAVVNYTIVSDVYNYGPKYDALNEYKRSFNVKIIHFGYPSHF